MGPIKAVSISASQHRNVLSLSASLIDQEDDRKYSVRMQWDVDNPPSVQRTSTEWLYGVLCSMLENFDDHDVTEVKVEGVQLMQEVSEDA